MSVLVDKRCAERRKSGKTVSPAPTAVDGLELVGLQTGAGSGLPGQGGGRGKVVVTGVSGACGADL